MKKSELLIHSTIEFILHIWNFSEDLKYYNFIDIIKGYIPSCLIDKILTFTTRTICDEIVLESLDLLLLSIKKFWKSHYSSRKLIKNLLGITTKRFKSEASLINSVKYTCYFFNLE